MPMTRTVAVLSLLGALALGAIASPPARAQAVNCNWYADTSLKQQQRNEQGKCGFTGAEWSSDRKAHLSWCGTQAPDTWRAAAQKREQMLAGCKR
jgi:hypothetical protein